jgi:hypothetical protein
MTEREAEFCSFREVKLLVCSWNIDSAKPTDLGGSEANATFLEELMSSVDRPDIIVFGFQEVIPLTDKKLTASEFVSPGFHQREADICVRNTTLWRKEQGDELDCGQDLLCVPTLAGQTHPGRQTRHASRLQLCQDPLGKSCRVVHLCICQIRGKGQSARHQHYNCEAVSADLCLHV